MIAAQIANPVLEGFNPDPSICRVGDTYYIATSTFEWYPGVQVFKSTDLQNWTFVTRILDEARLLDMTGVPDSCGVWAPCLTYADNKFWLVYTAVTRFDGEFKDTPNYLTTAPSIEGPWSDPVYLNSSGFDPSLYHGEDGRKWFSNMVWDHRPDRTYFRGIVLQEYSHEDGQLVGPKEIITPGTKAGFTEGPHIYKRGGYFYLMLAEGGTGYDHCVSFMRATEISGPYEADPDGPLITARDRPEAGLQRAGHGGYVETVDGRHFITHLCSRPIAGTKCSPMGRETAIQEIIWNDAGWPRLKYPETAVEAKQKSRLASEHYIFDGVLHDDFQWLRTPRKEHLFSLEDSPGKLRLFGRNSIGSFFHSALVARRQTHYAYRAETCMSFRPNNFQQMAGLTSYYNAHKFYYLYVSCDESNNRHLAVMSCLAEQSLSADYPLAGEEIILPDEGDIFLAVNVYGTSLTFEYSLDNENWHKVGAELDARILCDEAGKGEGANFTGTFVGMCCQDVTGEGQSADFAYFKYEEVAYGNV